MLSIRKWLAVLALPEFRPEEAPRESRTLFSHADAEARFGASVFWYAKACYGGGNAAVPRDVAN